MSVTLYLCSNPQNYEIPVKKSNELWSYALPLKTLIEKVRTWFMEEFSSLKPIVDKTMIFCFSGALLSPLISPLIQKFLSWSSVKNNQVISLFSSTNIFCVFMAYNLVKLLYNIQMDGINCAKAMCDRCNKEIEDTKKQVGDLESKIDLFDWFINSNPRLQKIYIEYWNKFPRYVNLFEPLEEETVFETIFDERCHFAKNLIRLERHLSERIKFVQRHREVRECFAEHFRHYANSFTRKQSKPEIKEFLLEN
jgi:hypothetical protein